MKRFFTLALLSVATLALSSCFELTAVVSVNKDGSGVIEETTLVSSQLKAMLKSQAGSESSNSILPTPEKAAEKAAKLGEGVTLKSAEEIKSPDGREGVKVVYSFTDIRKVKYEPGDLKDDGNVKKRIGFDLEGDTLSVSIPQEKPVDGKPTEPKPDAPNAAAMEQQLAMMKPMLAGMRMTFQVKAPGGIVSSDATYTNGDTVTLMDMNFDLLMGTPLGMKKFGS